MAQRKWAPPRTRSPARTRRSSPSPVRVAGFIKKALVGQGRLAASAVGDRAADRHTVMRTRTSRSGRRRSRTATSFDSEAAVPGPSSTACFGGHQPAGTSTRCSGKLQASTMPTSSSAAWSGRRRVTAGLMQVLAASTSTRRSPATPQAGAKGRGADSSGSIAGNPVIDGWRRRGGDGFERYRGRATTGLRSAGHDPDRAGSGGHLGAYAARPARSPRMATRMPPRLPHGSTGDGHRQLLRQATGTT